MKKILGIFLILLFAFSLVFTVSSNITTKVNESPTFAELIPIPPPEKPKKGC